MCFRNHPVKQCGLFVDVVVCIHCCILCLKRNVCPSKAWALDVEKKPSKQASREEIEKFLEEIEFLSKKTKGRG